MARTQTSFLVGYSRHEVIYLRFWDIPLPNSALISNDGDSFISNTESEGGFGGANDDESGSKDAFPNERAQGPNFEKKVSLSPIIKTKFAYTSSCTIPKYQSYELTRT